MPTKAKIHNSEKKKAPRGKTAERGYGGRWQRETKQFKRRNPYCVEHLARGVVCAAIAVDHIIPHRGNKKLFWDQTNWQGLYLRCHNQKTGRGE